MKRRNSIVIIGVLLWTFTNQAKAYLPSFSYIEGAVTRDGRSTWWRGNKGVQVDGGYRTEIEITDVVIEGGKYEVNEVYEKRGPIRYYYEVIMPQVPGEPLYLEMSDDSIRWMDKNLPANSPNIKTWTATTKAMEHVVRKQQRSVALLLKYREEIGRLHNEYLRYGVDTHKLDSLCKMYKSILTDKYWRDLKKSKSQYNGLPQSISTMDDIYREKQSRYLRHFKWGFEPIGPLGLGWRFLEFGCAFDIEVAKAYEPLIDVRISGYKKYRQSLGTDAQLVDQNVQKKIEELEREVKKANRKAQEADNRAAHAIQEAEKANRINHLDPSNPDDRWMMKRMFR